MSITGFISLALDIFSLLIAATITYALIHSYLVQRKTVGWKTAKWYQCCWLVARDSATWFLGYAQLITSAFLNNLDSLATALGHPKIAEILNSHFDPKVAGYVLLASGLFILWARGRTL